MLPVGQLSFAINLALNVSFTNVATHESPVIVGLKIQFN